MKKFVGRVAIPGEARAHAVVSRYGFNPFAAYARTLAHGNHGAAEAIASDPQDTDLYGLRIDGRIICCPSAIGSTSAGPTWEFVAARGVAPAALLFSGPVDTLTAGGLVLALVWAGRRVPCIGELGAEFLDHVANGSLVAVKPGGVVEVADY